MTLPWIDERHKRPGDEHLLLLGSEIFHWNPEIKHLRVRGYEYIEWECPDSLPEEGRHRGRPLFHISRRFFLRGKVSRQGNLPVQIGGKRRRGFCRYESDRIKGE